MSAESAARPLTDAEVQVLAAKLHDFAAHLAPREQTALAVVLRRAAVASGGEDVEGYYSAIYHTLPTYYRWLSGALTDVVGPRPPGRRGTDT